MMYAQCLLGGRHPCQGDDQRGKNIPKIKTKTMKHHIHLPKSLSPWDTWCDSPAPDTGHKVDSLSPCPGSLPNHVHGQEMKKRGRISAEALGREEMFVVQWLPSPFCFAELYK